MTDLKTYLDAVEKRIEVVGMPLQLDAVALLKITRRLLDAVEKINDGPGNKMANWKLTWAHEYSGAALQDVSEIVKGVRG